MNEHSNQEVIKPQAGVAIQWTEITVGIEQLRPFEHNPRRITESQFHKLKASMMKHGQFAPLLANHELRLAGGHQRMRIARELGWDMVRVSVPSIAISDDHYMELVLLSNHSNGQWDMDILSSLFDLEFLRTEIGLHDILGIPPAEEEQPKPSGQVRCPACEAEFPVKGNKV